MALAVAMAITAGVLREASLGVQRMKSWELSRAQSWMTPNDGAVQVMAFCVVGDEGQEETVCGHQSLCAVPLLLELAARLGPIHVNGRPVLLVASRLPWHEHPRLHHKERHGLLFLVSLLVSSNSDASLESSPESKDSIQYPGRTFNTTSRTWHPTTSFLLLCTGLSCSLAGWLAGWLNG